MWFVVWNVVCGVQLLWDVVWVIEQCGSGECVVLKGVLLC